MGSQCCKCASEKTQRAIASNSSAGTRTRGGSGSAIEGDRFIIEGSSLRLRGAQLDDADLYKAVATNAAGESSIEFQLDVHAAPGDVPRFIRRLNDLAVKVGTRTRLLVEIRSATDVKTVWYREDREIPESDRHNFLHEGSFFCVDVAPVTLEDSGVWSCVAHNTDGRSSCSCRLNVLVPKAYKKPEFVEELKAVLTEGGTVSLECKVIGVPTPQLRWFKDGEQIKAGDVFALSADPSDPTTLGTYTCEATNCMGRAISTSRVHVNAVNGGKHVDSLLPSGPVPKFSEDLQNQKVKIGGQMTLECKVEVPPWPSKISWFNSQGEVQEGGRYHLMADGLGSYSCAVDPIEVVDQGQWKCVATSDLGLKSITVSNVVVSFPKNYRAPRFLESLRAVLTEEGLVSFECKVVGYPTPHLQWFKDGQELKPGDVYQLTGTNSLGSYCCIARNCMGEAKSTAELTVEDIQSQLSEEEKLQLADRISSGQDKRQPPRFLIGLKSAQANINEPFKFTVQVTVNPEPMVAWYRDDEEVLGSDSVALLKETHGVCHLSFSRLEFADQAEWKCVATNDYGQSVTSCFLKLNIPKHFKKPRFLECLRAVLSEEGAVNLECKVIGVPQPTLKWYKDGRELKPGDIHKIISGEDGTCCLGVYTCEAHNCMGIASSSASLLGFEEHAALKQEAARKQAAATAVQALTRQPSLSTIQEERTSQLQEVSFSFDGKEVSVSLYETPDLTEEEALQIVEMYAEELSEHVSEHNVVELPPMRFVKETSTSGHILMEAVVIDVSPEYYASAEDDMRTDADLDEFSITEEPVIHVPNVFSSEDIPYDKMNPEFVQRSLAPISPLSETDDNIIPKKVRKKESPSKGKDSDKSSSGPYSDALASEKETKSQKDSFASAVGSPEKEISYDFREHIELETKSSPAVMETNRDLTAKPKAADVHVKRSKSRSQSKEKETSVKRSRRSLSKDKSSDESHLSDDKKRLRNQKHVRRKSRSESEIEDDSLQEFERRKALDNQPKYTEGEDSTSPEIRKKNGKIKSTDSEREDDSLVEFENRKSIKETASGHELKRSKSREQAQKRAMKKRGSTDSSSKEDDSLVEYEKRKTLSTGTSSIKTSRSKKGGLNKRGSSESSEKEEDVQKEEIEKKRKKKGIKQITTVSGKETTPETGVEVIQSSETDSVGRGVVLEAFARVENKDDGDETTEFDTAEDSAYDKSEMSVLESLTQSLNEIQKGLAKVEEQIISESSEEPETAKSSLSVIESLVQPINELKKSIEVVEKQIEEESIYGDYNPSKAGLTILETLAQPVQEFERNLALVEQQTSLEGLEESLLERTSQSILDTVVQPLQELHRDIALIQQQAVMEASDPYSDILQSFKSPFIEVQGGILQSEKDFTSRVEDLSDMTTVIQPTYAEVVDELQKGLTQLVEQSIFDSTNVDSIADSIPITVVELEKDKQERENFIQKLKIIEETAKKETDFYEDRLGKCMQIINKKITNCNDDELQYILKSISSFEQPLRSLQNITNKCIADVSENTSSTPWDVRPSSKQEMIQSLTRPFEVLNQSISLLEKIATRETINETRGLGMVSLYKLAIPIDELKTTIKLVENLSSYTAIEFLSPPVENILSALSTVGHEMSKDDFIENIPTVGENIIKGLDDSVDVMVNCINSIEKYSPESIHSYQKERGGTSLYSLIKPLEEFQKNLHSLQLDISDEEKVNSLNTVQVYHMAQELGKPLHAIRIELSIIKHQIELDEYSSFSLQPSEIILEGNTVMTNLLEPVENVQKSVSTFYESIVCRTPEEPIHVRYVLLGLKNLIQPVNALCSSIMKTEEQILQDVPSLSEPSLGLRIVTQSVHELRDSIESIKNQSHEILAQPEIIIISDILSTLSNPLAKVEDSLISISDQVHEEDKTLLNINLLKTLAEPFKVLQKALININNEFANENISEAVLFELKQPVQELQRSILVIQDQVSFEYGDEPTPIESNIVTLQSLIQPMKTLKRHFVNIQKLIAEQNKSKEIQIAQKIVGISKVVHKLQLKVSSLMVQQSYFRVSKHTGHLELFPALQYLVQFLNDFERALNHTEQYIARKQTVKVGRVKEKLFNNVQYLKLDMINLHKKLNNLKDLSPSDCESTEILTKAINEFTVALEDECRLLSEATSDETSVITCLESHFESFIEHVNILHSKLLLIESKITPFVVDEDSLKQTKEEKRLPESISTPISVLEVTANALQSKLSSVMTLAENSTTDKDDMPLTNIVEDILQNIESLKGDITDAKQESDINVLKEIIEDKISNKSEEIGSLMTSLRSEIQHAAVVETIPNEILQSVENTVQNMVQLKVVINNKIDELSTPEEIIYAETKVDKDIPEPKISKSNEDISKEDLILGSLNIITNDIKENVEASATREGTIGYMNESSDQINAVLAGINKLSNNLFTSGEKKEHQCDEKEKLENCTCLDSITDTLSKMKTEITSQRFDTNQKNVVVKSLEDLQNAVMSVKEEIKASHSLSVLEPLLEPLKEFSEVILNQCTSQKESEIYEGLITEEITPLETLEEKSLKILEEFARVSTDLELGLMKVEHNILNAVDPNKGKTVNVDPLLQPIQQLSEKIAQVEELTSETSECLGEQASLSLSMLKTLAQPIREIENNILNIQQQVLETTGKGEFGFKILEVIAKPIRELRTGIALIQEQAVIAEADAITLSEPTKDFPIEEIATPLQELKNVLNSIIEQQAIVFEPNVESISEKETLSQLQAIAIPMNVLQKQLAEIQTQQILEGAADELSIKEALNELAKPVMELQHAIATIESHEIFETIDKDISSKQSEVLKKLAKPLLEVSRGIAYMTEQQVLDDVISNTTISDLPTLASPTDVSLEVAVEVQQPVLLECYETFSQLEQKTKANATASESKSIAIVEQKQILEARGELETESSFEATKLNVDVTTEPGSIVVTPQPVVFESEGKLQEEIKPENGSQKFISLEQQAATKEAQQVMEQSGNIKTEEVNLVTASVKDSSFKEIALIEEQTSISKLESLEQKYEKLATAEVTQSLSEAVIEENQQILSNIEQLPSEDSLPSTKAALTLSALEVVEQMQPYHQEEAETLSDADTLTSATLAAECEVTAYSTAEYEAEVIIQEARKHSSEQDLIKDEQLELVKEPVADEKPHVRTEFEASANATQVDKTDFGNEITDKETEKKPIEIKDKDIVSIKKETEEIEPNQAKNIKEDQQSKVPLEEEGSGHKEKELIKEQVKVNDHQLKEKKSDENKRQEIFAEESEIKEEIKISKSLESAEVIQKETEGVEEFIKQESIAQSAQEPRKELIQPKQQEMKEQSTKTNEADKKIHDKIIEEYKKSDLVEIMEEPKTKDNKENYEGKDDKETEVGLKKAEPEDVAKLPGDTAMEKSGVALESMKQSVKAEPIEDKTKSSELGKTTEDKISPQELRMKSEITESKKESKAKEVKKVDNEDDTKLTMVKESAVAPEEKQTELDKVLEGKFEAEVTKKDKAREIIIEKEKKNFPEFIENDIPEKATENITDELQNITDELVQMDKGKRTDRVHGTEQETLSKIQKSVIDQTHIKESMEQLKTESVDVTNKEEQLLTQAEDLNKKQFRKTALIKDGKLLEEETLSMEGKSTNIIDSKDTSEFEKGDEKEKILTVEQVKSQEILLETDIKLDKKVTRELETVKSKLEEVRQILKLENEEKREGAEKELQKNEEKNKEKIIEEKISKENNEKQPSAGEPVILEKITKTEVEAISTEDKKGLKNAEPKDVANLTGDRTMEKSGIALESMKQSIKAEPIDDKTKPTEVGKRTEHKISAEELRMKSEILETKEKSTEISDIKPVVEGKLEESKVSETTEEQRYEKEFELKSVTIEKRKKASKKLSDEKGETIGEVEIKESDFITEKKEKQTTENDGLQELEGTIKTEKPTIIGILPDVEDEFKRGKETEGKNTPVEQGPKEKPENTALLSIKRDRIELDELEKNDKESETAKDEGDEARLKEAVKLSNKENFSTKSLEDGKKPVEISEKLMIQDEKAEDTITNVEQEIVKDDTTIEKSLEKDDSKEEIEDKNKFEKGHGIQKKSKKMKAENLEKSNVRNIESQEEKDDKTFKERKDSDKQVEVKLDTEGDEIRDKKKGKTEEKTDRSEKQIKKKDGISDSIKNKDGIPEKDDNQKKAEIKGQAGKKEEKVLTKDEAKEESLKANLQIELEIGEKVEKTANEPLEKDKTKDIAETEDLQKQAELKNKTVKQTKESMKEADTKVKSEKDLQIIESKEKAGSKNKSLENEETKKEGEKMILIKDITENKNLCKPAELIDGNLQNKLETTKEEIKELAIKDESKFEKKVQESLRKDETKGKEEKEELKKQVEIIDKTEGKTKELLKNDDIKIKPKKDENGVEMKEGKKEDSLKKNEEKPEKEGVQNKNTIEAKTSDKTESLIKDEETRKEAEVEDLQKQVEIVDKTDEKTKECFKKDDIKVKSEKDQKKEEIKEESKNKEESSKKNEPQKKSEKEGSQNKPMTEATSDKKESLVRDEETKKEVVVEDVQKKAEAKEVPEKIKASLKTNKVSGIKDDDFQNKIEREEITENQDRKTEDLVQKDNLQKKAEIEHRTDKGTKEPLKKDDTKGKSDKKEEQKTIRNENKEEKKMEGKDKTKKKKIEESKEADKNENKTKPGENTKMEEPLKKDETQEKVERAEQQKKYDEVTEPFKKDEETKEKFGRHDDQKVVDGNKKTEMKMEEKLKKDHLKEKTEKEDSQMNETETKTEKKLEEPLKRKESLTNSKSDDYQKISKDQEKQNKKADKNKEVCDRVESKEINKKETQEKISKDVNIKSEEKARKSPEKKKKIEKSEKDEDILKKPNTLTNGDGKKDEHASSTGNKDEQLGKPKDKLLNETRKEEPQIKDDNKFVKKDNKRKESLKEDNLTEKKNDIKATQEELPGGKLSHKHDLEKNQGNKFSSHKMGDVHEKVKSRGATLDENEKTYEHDSKIKLRQEGDILTKSDSLHERRQSKDAKKLKENEGFKRTVSDKNKQSREEELQIVSKENGEFKHSQNDKGTSLKQMKRSEKDNSTRKEKEYKTVSIYEDKSLNKSNDNRSIWMKSSSSDKEVDRYRRSKSEDHRMWVSSTTEQKVKRFHEESSSSESATQPPKPTWTRRESKCKPYFCGRLMDRTSPQGARIKMSCSFIGSPDPTVKWMKDGLPLLYSTADPLAQRFDTKVNNGIATLEIHSASPSDCGRYTCVASNTFGEATTTATLRIFTPFEPTAVPPTFISRIQDEYKFSDDQLILECRVTGQPHPTTTWFKDGKEIPARGRYQQSEMSNGICQLIICGPEQSDSGFYTCRAQNMISTEQISDLVTFQGRANYSAEREYERLSKSCKYDSRRPQVVNLMTDHVIPAGGMLALHVQVKGLPHPQVKWFRGSEPVEKRALTLKEGGLYSLILPDVAPQEAGLYTCRASNAYGHVDTSAHVQIVTLSSQVKGKPAMFIRRPDTRLTVAEGEDICVSLRLTGDPKPRVTWMKGLKDMCGCARSMKESLGDCVRLTLKRATQWDAGTYFIVAKNIYGSDRAFFTVNVRQRARSLTPISWDTSDTNLLLKDIHEMVQSSLKDVPGPVDSEPVVTDGGRTWLTLTWSKPRHQGAAPILAYKVEAWQLGEDGGARWDELGVTPISTFDAFELKPGASYKFRVTARNRFGWGEPTVTREPIIAGCQHLRPEIVTDLPGQLKALQSTNLTLQCEIRGEPQPDIRWYHDGREVAVSRSKDDRLAVKTNGELCSLLIRDLCPEDSGRYICEGTNKLGRASTFVRLLVVQEPRLLKAAYQLKRIQDGDETELTTLESPPQFCLRLRDRRVQTSYPVRLTCQVIGYPTPEISWFKDGEHIQEDDRHSFWHEENFQTLEISRARIEDNGQYSVSARNEHGSVSCCCQLIVDKGIKDYVSPGFIYSVDDVVTVIEGRELRLRAQVEAYPAVGITWHRDGIRLRQSRRLVITLDKEGRTELSLADVTPRDAGTYCCTAVNEVGRAETSCQVIIQPKIGGPVQSSGIPPLLSSTTNSDLPYTKPPMFLTKPRSTSAVEGDTVVIMCEVLGDPKPEVVWLRDWLKPGYYRDAPQFLCSNDGPQYRLEIPHVKLEFTGAYCVLARNEHGEARAVISLQVFARGQGIEGDMNSGQVGVKQSNVQTLPEIVRELKDIRCCDGDSVTLECKIYAQPLPETRWLKDGKILPMGGDISNELDGDIARLTIKKVYPEDEGEYTCMAYNELGRALTSACLVVDVPEEKEVMVSRQLVKPPGFLSTPSTPRTTPSRSISPGIQVSRDFTTPVGLSTTRSRRPKLSSPKFYAVPHNRVAEVGETVRFQCSVAGHPIPWASWDKDGRIVASSARYTVLEQDDLRMLQIKEVTEEDAGLYRVTLENDYGSIEATARLEVISHRGSKVKGVRAWSASRASPTFGRRLVGSAARVGGTFTLSCDVQASPSPVIVWYRNAEVVVRSERVTPLWDGRTACLKLKDLKSDDAGVYTCVAENELGRTRCSAELVVLDVTDPSDADLRPPVFVTGLPELTPATEGQPFELQVKLLGTEPLEVVWVKDDAELPDCMDFRYVDYGDGRFGLRIADVFTADAGIYACEAFNPHGDAITSGRLEVTETTDLTENRKKQLYFTKTPTPLDVEPGNCASFCARLHSPADMPMHIVWSVAGQPVLGNCERFKVEQDGDSTILRIHPVMSCDIGPVSCRAHICCESHKEPILGCTKCYVVSCTSRLATVSDNSEGRPAILLQGPEDTTALRGQRVILKAMFSGHPQPSVRWLKAGRELSSEGCMQIITTTDPDNTEGESSLILDPVSSDDSGKYVVSVENCLGADCHFASVAVEGPPDPPAGRPSATAMDDNSVTIAWSSPPYDGGCMVTGYRIEMKNNSDTDWTVIADRCHSLSHVVHALIPGQYYAFRVRAENVHGASQPSIETFPVLVGRQISDNYEDMFEIDNKPVVVQPGEEFVSRFEVLEELGKGRYGVVHRVIDRKSNCNMAAKFVRCIKKQDRQKVHEEIDIMNCLRHPKLLQLTASYENSREVIMVMEYITGGELFERVVADDFTLTERDCILFMRQICEGVEYMHQNSIVHLDLKPENIMCHTRTSHQIKVIDFGLAQKLSPDTTLRALFGTPEFIPPEIINYEPIGIESDMWSLGVICYVLLSGLSPFMGDNDAETFANITRADFDFDDEAFDAISQDSKDFISGLLVKRKEKRMSARQCLQHKWLSQCDTDMNCVKLSTDKLKKFIIRRKWQKTGNAIRALGRMATLSAASRRNSSSPRPSLSGGPGSPRSRMSSFTLNEEQSQYANIASDPVKQTRVRMCSERSDSGFSDCSSHYSSVTPQIINSTFSISEENEVCCDNPSDSINTISPIKFNDFNNRLKNNNVSANTNSDSQIIKDLSKANNSNGSSKISSNSSTSSNNSSNSDNYSDSNKGRTNNLVRSSPFLKNSFVDGKSSLQKTNKQFDVLSCTANPKQQTTSGIKSQLRTPERSFQKEKSPTLQKDAHILEKQSVNFQKAFAFWKR